MKVSVISFSALLLGLTWEYAAGQTGNVMFLFLFIKFKRECCLTGNDIQNSIVSKSKLSSFHYRSFSKSLSE